MRLALLSDIHGNLIALESVLSDLATESIDQIICLGDVAIFGPQPRETLARVQTLECPVIMGNTDAWSLDPKPHPTRDENTPIFNDIELWGAELFTDEDRDFIRTFQPTLEISLDQDVTLLCYHGSPQSFDDMIVATTPDEELERMFGTHRATIMAGGHTHAQYVRRYQEMIVLNPGSVGLPFEYRPGGQTVRNPPWAEYAMIEYQKGQLKIELQRTPIDIDAVIQTAMESGMPHAEWWAQDWRRS